LVSCRAFPQTSCSFMNEVETLQFESGRILQALYGNDLGLLKTVEQALEVRLTTREGWLRVEGQADKIAQVRKLFQQLEKARQNGVSIRRQEFQYAMRALQQPQGMGIDELSQTRVSVPRGARLSPQKPPINVRT
jgi:phosphate starvation-inducible PhoH-like protein